MRLRYMSDLHCEFMGSPTWKHFVDRVRGPIDAVFEGEALVLAGDISLAWPPEGVVGISLREVLSYFAERFNAVVYLPGNHEYYGALPSDVRGTIETVAITHDNFHPLDEGQMAIIDGQRFVGTTLWFPPPPASAPKWALNDYAQIEGFGEWVGPANRRAVAFLKEEVTANDVVVTHHLPSPRSIHPKYKDSELNPFFLCDLTPLIWQRQPKLWIHGHTHDSCNYRIGATRVVCNPFGYYDHEVNAAFDPRAAVEL